MYVLQVKTGCEVSAGKTLREMGYNVKVPEKTMNVRHGGVWKLRRYLVFTGYIFLDADSIMPNDYYRIKETAGVVKFIGGGNPLSMSETERQYICWLWNGGKPIEPSKVFVTVNGQKMILSGLLRKYDYADINVRQRRARVMIPICGVLHKITLPIEVV